MALKVPPPHIVAIKKFLELPDAKIAQLLDALAKAGPQFNLSDLAREISGHLDSPRDISEGIVNVLGSLYLTRESQNAPVEAFVDQEVHNALKRADIFSGKNGEAQWVKLRDFLIVALALDNTVGTAAKAGHVLTQHERIFVAATILTDVRPIFHVDVSEKPQSAVIVHMLRIVQRDYFGNQEDKYFALDSNDIRNIRMLIDRAMKKEETLKNLMNDSGVTVLTPKSFF